MKKKKYAIKVIDKGRFRPKQYDLFRREMQILKDMDLVKATNLYGNKAKGTHANKQINSWGKHCGEYGDRPASLGQRAY